MFLFNNNKRIKSCCNKKVRQNSPEVIAAKEYLTKTHPTLLPILYYTMKNVKK